MGSVAAMETVEEAQNRVEFLKLVDEGEEGQDRIGALPDCLLLEVLSRLPSTKDTIRTGTLSKRWKNLWTLVPTLIFRHSDYRRTHYRQRPYSRSDFFSFVDKTLTQCCQLKLNKFEVHTSYDIRSKGQFNNWIRYVVSCKVEELNLKFAFMEEAKFPLDQFFFVNSCITNLTLEGCILNPNGAISWKYLRRLCIAYARLDDDLIGNIISGSPLLETLVLNDCYGYRRLDITSKSLKNLVLSAYYDPDDEYYHDNIIEINAPNILSLTIYDELMLWKVLLVNVSSLVKAILDYTKGGYSETTRDEAEEEMLKGFILNLRHVKELKIGVKYSEFFMVSVDAMETVEEAQNRIEFLKLVDEGEEGQDRIGELPDCLLLEVLTRLPSTKYAIRTGTLSKRWKHRWTSVPTLIFRHSDYRRTHYRQRPYSRSDFFSFVDKTLTQRRQLKLNKFEVHTSYDIRSKGQFNNWIRYAVSCNVEELNLKFAFMEEAKFPLDQFFFVNSCFTNLTLEGCILNPNGAISWKYLRRLCIAYARLDDDLIGNIISGSPLLETLVLNDCYGYRRLDITSKSLKNLVLSGYYDPDEDNDEYYHDNIIEINAPNILSLTIYDELMLWKVLLVNVSSLVKAILDYAKGGYSETTRDEAEEEMLKGFILNLRHVKELKIGVKYSEALSRLEAKGFVFPSNFELA